MKHLTEEQARAIAKEYYLPKASADELTDRAWTYEMHHSNQSPRQSYRDGWRECEAELEMEVKWGWWKRIGWAYIVGLLILGFTAGLILWYFILIYNQCGIL